MERLRHGEGRVNAADRIALLLGRAIMRSEALQVELESVQTDLKFVQDKLSSDRLYIEHLEGGGSVIRPDVGDGDDADG